MDHVIAKAATSSSDPFYIFASKYSNFTHFKFLLSKLVSIFLIYFPNFHFTIPCRPSNLHLFVVWLSLCHIFQSFVATFRLVAEFRKLCRSEIPSKMCVNDDERFKRVISLSLLTEAAENISLLSALFLYELGWYAQ